MNESYIVYQHLNPQTNKSYIGITKQRVQDRWKNGDGYKRQAFYKQIQKYGWDSFEHIILLEGLTLEEAEYFETFFIDYFDSWENGYNVDMANGPINALCGEYYRESNIPVVPSELLKLYRKRGTVDIEWLEMLDEFRQEALRRLAEKN